MGIIEKIDVVYTWCDASDEKFRCLRQETLAKNGIPLNTNDEQLDVKKRYQNNDELLFSLRSLEKYASWVNHIFIVTNNQRPTWLSDNPKISVIDHNEILPKEIQPVFNSVAIEQYITEIPGLSEYFLYLCDDMFFNRPVKPCDFFINGKPVVWCMPSPCEYNFSQDSFTRTLYNAYLLFLEKHKKYVPFFSVHHGIDAYSKTLLRNVLSVYPETFELNSTPFRDVRNVQRILWSYEFRYINDCPMRLDYSGISIIKMVLAFCFRRKVFWNVIYDPDKKFYWFLSRLFFKRPYCFCLNNLCDTAAVTALSWLKKRFPQKSEFEK